MEKSKKKRLIFNIFLLVLIVILIVTVVVLYIKKSDDYKKKREENVELRDVGYDTSIGHVSFPTARGIAEAYVAAYNDNSGEELASIMNLPALYVLEDVEESLLDEGVSKDELEEKAIERFDDKYVQIMKAPDEYENFVAMQYSMAQYEQEVIDSMPAKVATYTLLNKPEIQDITRFISKMTLEIKIESPAENVDETHTLELLLFKRDDNYHLLRINIKDTAQN